MNLGDIQSVPFVHVRLGLAKTCSSQVGMCNKVNEISWLILYYPRITHAQCGYEEEFKIP